VVAGDFNEDVHNEGLRGLLDLGFTSALAEHEPDARTWRWEGVPLQLRLDHVAFDNRAFELVSAAVVERGKSDHLPVKVVLRRKAG
jgi:endonuclease/exonuclease/phosphatase family metal-dependent hydrolase